jgi:hypothetical protein
MISSTAIKPFSQSLLIEQIRASSLNKMQPNLRLPRQMDKDELKMEEKGGALTINSVLRSQKSKLCLA